MHLDLSFWDPTDWLTACADERVVNESFPFADYPGSQQALREKYQAFRFRDPDGAVQPWTGLMLGKLSELLTDPGALARDTRGRYDDLSVIPGACHGNDDNHIARIVANTFPGWTRSHPLNQRLLVTAILLTDLDAIATTPLCPRRNSNITPLVT